MPLEGGESPRAEREALAAARLAHPGIVALYEAGRDDDAYYLVSELVRGRTLGELERDGALSDLDVVRIGAALCDALEHAHARGVIHRDVKPANVMVPEASDDGAGVAKLTDFGIARLADAAALTRTGDVVGTLAYMAPEQAEGRRVTGAADLYALALVLYEALSGSNPVRAEGAAATARRVGMRLPPLRPPAPRPAARALRRPRRRARPRARAARGDSATCARRCSRRAPHVDDEPGASRRAAVEAARRAHARVARRSRGQARRGTGAGVEPRGGGGAQAPRPRGAQEAERRAEEARRAVEPEAGRASSPRRSPAACSPASAPAPSPAGRSASLPLDVTAGGALPELDPFIAAAARRRRRRAAAAPGLDRRARGAARRPRARAHDARGRRGRASRSILLVPRQGTLWSLPAAAPRSTSIGLAGA